MTNNSLAQLKYKYGLTRDEYHKLLLQQDGKCAACSKGETVLGKSGSARSLSVDHNHRTGTVRGLLCDSCNNILARAKDSPAVLRRLAAYLEVAESKEPKVNAERMLEELMKGEFQCLPA